MYTVDYIDREWYVMQPNSGGRACVRCHYEADARMIADALNESAQLRAENERIKDAIRAVMLEHDAKARAANFAACGCGYCAALRPTLKGGAV